MDAYTLHIFKMIHTGPLLIMSHQIFIDTTLNVGCFLNEVEVPTKITDIHDIRKISELTEGLDTYQQDDIEAGINKAIGAVRSTIKKLSTYEDGKDSQGVLKSAAIYLVST